RRRGPPHLACGAATSACTSSTCCRPTKVATSISSSAAGAPRCRATRIERSSTNDPGSPATSSSAVYPSLRDRPVLITGGATGIGACLVERFVAQGARVAFIDIDVRSGLALAEGLAGAAHAPLFLEADLTDI